MDARRRTPISARWLVLVGFSIPACSRPQLPPNIILIVVDTLRADYLGSYGFEGAISPNLDRLASESVVFEQCFAQAPWTKPSTASLLTSLYPQVHGLTNHEGKYWGEGSAEARTGILPDRAVTLAEELRDAGYRTAAIVSNPWLHHDYGFAQGFDFYDDHAAWSFARGDVIVDAARTWIEERGTEPFFLYVHFMDVHAPYGAPKVDFDALSGAPSLKADLELSEAQVPYNRWSNIEVRPDWATDAARHRLAYWRTRYASGVRAFDRSVQTLLYHLEHAGLLETSWVVLTSDHGEQLFEHGDWSHGRSLYDHQLHVPLIMRAPRARDAGRRVGTIVQHVDLMPTLLSLAGVPLPDGLQGRDLSALLAGGSLATDEEVSFGTATETRPGLCTVRTPTHRLVLDVESGEMQLFDLVSDPGEQRNLAADSPELAEKLRDRLALHLVESTAAGTLESETGAVPESLRRQLEALGY
ncbi:MAG: hypothetical protein E2O39_09705 [Planctomycetota bacterium]|nr:MAG: hypothetical protein E2O39_09705 [Planctomycetota bacterium]